MGTSIGRIAGDRSLVIWIAKRDGNPLAKVQLFKFDVMLI